VPVHHRFQWLYVYGFVHPETGRTFLPIRPKVNVDQFNQALTDFAQFAGTNPTKHCVVALDPAGWHPSKKVVLPAAPTWCRCPRIHPNCNPPDVSGLLPMKA
jgi:hypothetical protein